MRDHEHRDGQLPRAVTKRGGTTVGLSLFPSSPRGTLNWNRLLSVTDDSTLSNFLHAQGLALAFSWL